MSGSRRVCGATWRSVSGAVLLGFAALAPTGRGQDAPAPVAPLQWEPAQPPRVDLEGVPLPDGAESRSGVVTPLHFSRWAGRLGGFVLDETALAVSSGDTWRVVAIPGAELRQEFAGDTRMPACAAGGRVAVEDGERVYVYDARSGEILGALPPGQPVSLSAGGGRLATRVEQETVVWDIASRKEVRRFPHRLLQVDATGLAVLGADGKSIALYQEGSVRILDVDSGREVRAARDLRGVEVISADLSTVAIDFGGEVSVARIAGGERRRLLTGKEHRWIGLSGDGRIVAVCVDRRALRIFDSTTGEELARLDALVELDRPLVSPSGRWVAVPDGSVVRVFDVPARREVGRKGNATPASSVTFSPDGARLYLTFAGGSLAAAEAATGRALPDPGRAASPAAWVKLWRSLHPGASAVPPGPWQLTSDGKVVAERRGEGDLAVLEVETGKALHTLTAKRHGVLNAFALSRDGRFLASAGKDPVLRVFDLRAGKEHMKIETPEDGRAVAFSADGALVAVAVDGRLRIFELPSGAGRATIEDGEGPLAFSPDGARIAAGDDLFDVATGKAVAKLTDSHAADVSAIAFSPDGRRLAAGSDDTTAVVWRLPDRDGSR